MKPIQERLATVAGCCVAVAALAFTVSLTQPSALAQAPAVTISAASATMETRSAFATNIEEQLRKRGIDVRAQLDGDQRDVLRIEWQSMTRRDIYNFVNSTMLRDAAPMVGFKSVVFTNGEHQWDYDLARESMVSHPAAQF